MDAITETSDEESYPKGIHYINLQIFGRDKIWDKIYAQFFSPKFE